MKYLRCLVDEVFVSLSGIQSTPDLTSQPDSQALAVYL